MCWSMRWRWRPVEDETMVSGDNNMLSHTPVARAGTIEESVDAVLFFCDPLNSYTTGQLLTRRWRMEHWLWPQFLTAP